MTDRRFLSVLLACLFLIGPMSMFLPSVAQDGRVLTDIITFTAPGVNQSMTRDIPRGSTVTTATMILEGKQYEGPGSVNRYDYSNRGESDGYYGCGREYPVTSDPATLMEFALTDSNYTQISSSNDVTMDRKCPYQSGPGLTNYSMYAHFRFKVLGENPIDIKVYWEGLGFHDDGQGNTGNEAKAWIFNARTTSWEKVGEYTGQTAEQVLTNTFQTNVEDYIDASGFIHVIVQNKPSPFGMIVTDYVYVTVNETNFPLDPSLDVGNDGDMEWSHTGMFQGTEGLNFSVELQEHIDAAGHGPGDIQIVFAFTSRSMGILEVHDLDIQYYPPEPPVWGTMPSLNLTEDDPTGKGDDLIDLYNYISDDDPLEGLVFEITYEEDSTKLDATIDADGHHMDFRTAPDWWGSMGFLVKATDIDGLETETPEFRVNVEAVNDAPRIEPVDLQSATAGVPFSLIILAKDVDTELDPTETITFSDDTEMFDIDPVTGAINFTPLEEDVGERTATVKASDKEGKSDQTTIGFKIREYDGTNNHPPALGQIGNLTTEEDAEFSFQVPFIDEDLIYGDVLTFTDNSDMFDIGSATGKISFTPIQEDVGVHEVIITVTDSIGASDSQGFFLIVLNMNDAPILGHIKDQTMDEGETLSLNAEAYDPDIGYDRDEILLFTDDCDLFDIDAWTGEMVIVSGPNDHGIYNVSITVTDNDGERVATTFTITVRDVNFPPVIGESEMPDNNTFKQSKGVVIKANATDPDGDVLTYLWRNAKGKTIGTDETLDTKALDSGMQTITLEVSDGVLNASKDFEIKVKPRKNGEKIPGFEGTLFMTAMLFGIFMVVVRRARRGL